MRSKAICLLALLLTPLLVPQTPLAAESTLGGQIEAGIYGQDIGKDGSKVDEYSSLGDDTVTGYGAFDLHGASATTTVELSADMKGSDGPQVDLKFDVNRILRFKGERSELTHRLSHDRIGYLDAAVPPPTGAPGSTVILSPDTVPGFIQPGTYNPVTGEVTVGGPAPGNALLDQQIGRASVFGEDLTPGQVFEIKRTEAKADADLTLPFLPNITFHAGLRNERREGTEQSIGMSKCTACHVTGGSRNVDENTDEFNAGATGRFGLFTVDYAFKNSEFRENAATPTRVYDPALSPGAAYTAYDPATNTLAQRPFDSRLLYDYSDGALTYDQTPDSEKTSHLLKARVDLPLQTALIGSFVNTRVESKKTDEPGIWTLGDKTLTSDYDGYGFRLASRPLDSVRVNLRGKLEKVDTDDAVITFVPMNTLAQPNLGGNLPAGTTFTNTYDSVESRDVVTLGADAIWRFAPKSTARLGYEFKTDDRDNEHYGKTTAQTAEVEVKTLLTKGLTARAGYTFKTIDDPFMHQHAAGFIDPLTGLPYTTNQDPTPTIATGDLYGTAFYDLRQTDLSNQPETIHEAKVASTWSPASSFSATATVRYRQEENALTSSEWKQQTLSPTLSFWYAPAQKLNLTFAYNYLGQRAESRFCQGWYDG
ncbi:MAG: hypothetical protein A2091_06725 [Desulfuromonadales bacterium GWD2_61_12]|nr:MAG: hypothetical protein A2005_10110 [Desulfuromonadales bacterium GWC2_61_20]OGR32916.1 MAG: hypothetical protein A2091_06725 [Desulfuromonadales bacterium GWD2_61_12]HAD05188.1 cytochrome C [Desulfuromonas sp.]HBT84260.1 cytochrome C [Desulfuromonas sp.]